MGKNDQLTGIANNLAESIISSTNQYYLKQLESLPIETTRSIAIDLLKERIEPECLMNGPIKDMISHYKKWFYSEIKTLRIDAEDIDNVTVKLETSLEMKLEKGTIRKYVCKATINAKGKEYKKEARASWQ